MQKILRPLAFALLLTTAMQVQAADAASPTNDPKMAPGGTYTVEPNHTHVAWFIGHMGFSHYMGQFTDITGKLEYHPDALNTSQVNIVVKTDSVKVNSEKLQGELQGEKFFNAEKYPEIIFISRSLKAVDKTHGKLTGDLTLSGVTKPIVLDVTFNGAGPNMMSKQPQLGFDATGTIKRSDFNFGAYPPPMLGDDIRLDISAEFVAVPTAPAASFDKIR